MMLRKIEMMSRKIYLITLLLVAALGLLVHTVTTRCMRWGYCNANALVGAAMKSDTERIVYCIGHGADINAPNRWGWHRELKGLTPLTAAVESGNLKTISCLVEFGADVNLTDGFMQTAAFGAAVRGDSEIIFLLANAGADFSRRCKGRTPLEMARELQHWEAERAIRQVLAER